MNNVMTAEDVALRLGVGHVYIYNMIDTRPKTGSGVPLPVPYYCRGHGVDWRVNAGDVVGFLNRLPIGEQVIIKEYCGVDVIEENIYVSTLAGWVSLE